jgi:dolichol-phosphate mannosyltransferase
VHNSLVIIPTYNEMENIDAIIQAVMSLDDYFHVLIVDDNSPDGTGNRVKELKADLHGDRLHLLERAGKLGLGTAYIAGFKYGIQHKYDYIFEMDADFSHNPKDLLRLLHPLKEANFDVSIGSRYTKGGGIKNWPTDRLVLSYGASIYVRMITWMSIKDPTAGFVGYKREVLETIDLDKISFVGYAFQIEMKYVSSLHGFRLIEVPITFIDRVLGSSKMSKGIITEAIFGVLNLKWRGLTGYYRG